MPATVASRQVRRYCSALVAVVIALLGAGIAGSASSADPGAAARLVRPVSRPARECDNVRRWRLHSATIWRWRKGIGNVAGNFSFTQTGGACQCGTRGTIWRQRTGSGTGEGTPPRSPPAEFELYKRNEAPSAGIVVESSSWPGEQSHFFYRVQTQAGSVGAISAARSRGHIGSLVTPAPEAAPRGCRRSRRVMVLQRRNSARPPAPLGAQLPRHTAKPSTAGDRAARAAAPDRPPECCDH
jgi:hypothetical protein